MTIAQTFDGFSGLSPEPLSPSTLNSSAHAAFFGAVDEQDQDESLDTFDDRPAQRNSKPGQGRKGPGAADKRATHNAIERARRESLNGRFMTLAEALPSMAKVKRPSKSVIVQNALSFVYDAQVKEHALIRENNELRRQVDQLRRQLGMAPLPPPAPLTGAGSSPTNTTPPATATKPQMMRHESFADSIASSSDVSGALTMSMGQLDPSAHSPPMMQQLSPASGSFPSPPSSSGPVDHSVLGTSPQLVGMFSTVSQGVNATLFSPTVTSTTSLGESPPAAGAFSPSTASEMMEERRQSASSQQLGGPFGSFGAGVASGSPASSLVQAQAAAAAQAHAQAQAQHQAHQQSLAHQQQQQQQILMAHHHQQMQQYGFMNPALLAANQSAMFAAMHGHGLGGGLALGVGALGGLGGGVNPFDMYAMQGAASVSGAGAAQGSAGQQGVWGSLGSESAGGSAFGSFS